MELDQQRFIQAVHERTGLDLQQASVLVTSTLEAIGRALAPTTVATVARMLPEPLAEALKRGVSSPGVGDVLVDLATQEQVSLGVAKEHVQVVLEQLATCMDEPTRAGLAQQLPDELASWLQRWQAPLERHAVPAGREHTLATGRPGSERSLSETAPDFGRTIAESRPGSERPISERRG